MGALAGVGKYTALCDYDDTHPEGTSSYKLRQYCVNRIMSSFTFALENFMYSCGKIQLWTHC